MKTFIRQPGNKSKHLRHILPHLPQEYNTYYEPFVGTGAVFIKLSPVKWVINDNNDDLMNLYQTIRDDLPNILKNIKSFATKTNFENISNDERLRILKEYMQKFIKLPFTTKRASYYLILKMTSYMSSIIFKGKYKFVSLDLNITKGKKPYLLSDKFYTNLEDVSKLLNSEGKIFATDYKKILKMVKKGDFCFIDPPYIEDHDYYFTYNNIQENNEKNDIDFVDELYKEVKKLDKKNVKWLMTQADTPQVRKQFKEYTIISYLVHRGFTNKCKNELIIKNY
jgi:DNA adenine methylase